MSSAKRKAPPTQLEWFLLVLSVNIVGYTAGALIWRSFNAERALVLMGAVVVGYTVAMYLRRALRGGAR